MLCLVGRVAAQRDSAALAQPLPLDPRVTAGILANGVRYYIRANARPENRAELRLVVNAGSVLEDDDQRGLAHFVEHMAFNGTEHFAKQELVDYLERVGMRLGPHVNASTGFDETVYMLHVPTDTAEVLATAFQILEDWAHLVAFEPEEIEQERAVVIEEWRLGRGAEARMLDQQLPVIFQGSRYADRLPIGTKQSLEGFDPATLRRFYRSWYRPDLMAVVAVGDFDPAVIEQLIEAHFSGIRSPPEAPERPLFEVPDHTGPLVAAATDPEATTSTVAIYYKHAVEPTGTVGAYRANLAARLYQGMFNSRLSELTQSPDAPFLFAGSGKGRFVRTKDVYYLFAGVEDGRVEVGLRGLLTEAERVVRHGFTATELDRERTELIRWMERAYAEREKQYSAVHASRYVQHALTGQPAPGIETELELARALVPTIGLEEMQHLANAWLTGENRVVVVSAPEKATSSLPPDDRLLAAFRDVETAEIAPYRDVSSDAPLLARPPRPGRVVREEHIPEVGLTIWTLGNGVRVLLKPTDFKDDEVLLRATSPGGHSLANDEHFVSAVMADEIMTRGGLGDVSQIQLGKRLAGKVASVFPAIGPLTEGLTGSASPRDIETMFQLVYLRFTKPRSDTASFVAFRQQLDGALANRSASPIAAFYDTVAVTLAQQHPRARPLTTEALAEMDLEQAVTFYQDRFADASDFTFVLVGNLALDAVRPLVETYLGSLPAMGRRETWRDVGVRPPTGIVRKTLRQGIEPRSQTQLVFTGPFEFTASERYVIGALADALELRLRERLREQLGGTYQVTVSGDYERDPRPEYSVRIGFGSSPERVDELLEAIFHEIQVLKAIGPATADVEKVRESQRRAKETSLRENGFWATQLLYADRYGLDPRHLSSFEEIDDLRSGAVRDAARRYLPSDRYVLVTLYPQSPL